MAGFHMDAREMTERLTLKTRGARTKDAHGHESWSWTTLATVWGKYVPARADERFAAAQMQADVTARFFVRQRSDVDETCRLEWKGVGYDITAATPLPGRVWMEVIARKEVKDGR